MARIEREGNRKIEIIYLKKNGTKKIHLIIQNSKAKF